MSEGNTSAHQLGWPDSGSSMRDMVDNARAIVLTVNILGFSRFERVAEPMGGRNVVWQPSRARGQSSGDAVATAARTGPRAAALTGSTAVTARARAPAARHSAPLQAGCFAQVRAAPGRCPGTPRL